MHTPGPWTVGNKSGRNCNIIFSGEHGVAGVYGVPMHCHISEVQNDPRYANPLSDAHLIAAAPDLLEALREIVRNDPYNQSSAGRIASAAIAKATQ